MDIVTALTNLGTGIAKLFTSVLQELATIFFTVSEAGAITMTPLGYLALIGLVVAIVYYLFRWISGLIRGRVGR
jgi:hypothetical protein